MLRKQLKVLEKSILKYGPLEDRELVLLNLARDTGHKAAQISSDLQNLKVYYILFRFLITNKFQTKILVTESEVRKLVF